MPLHEFTCESGNSYNCEIPELSVMEARLRLQQLRAHRDEQARLENRSVLIDRHYAEIADNADITDLDAALQRLDEAAERARVATEEAARLADSKLVIEFFCDGVQRMDPNTGVWTAMQFDELPAADASDLYLKCRATMMGNPLPETDQTG